MLARIRKLIVMLGTVAGAGATAITLPSPWDIVATGGIGIIGGVVHYYVPNAPIPVVTVTPAKKVTAKRVPAKPKP